MHLISVELHNAFRFGETANVVNFDELFAESGPDHSLALLAGVKRGLDGNDGQLDDSHSIAVGKSSIMEAVAYAFYGRLPRLTANTDKEGRATAEIIRCDENGAWDCDDAWVRIKFQIRDGSIWTIKRGRHVKKNRKTHEPILEVEREGAGSQIGHRKEEADQFIEQLIGIDYDSFCNSILFAQKDAGKFLCGTDRVRKDIFVSLLGLSVLDTWLAETRKRKKAVTPARDKAISEVQLLDSRVHERKTQGAADTLKAVGKRLKELAQQEQVRIKALEDSEAALEKLTEGEEARQLAETQARLQALRKQQTMAEMNIQHRLAQAKTAVKRTVAEKEQLESDKAAISARYTPARKTLERLTASFLQSEKDDIQAMVVQLSSTEERLAAVREQQAALLQKRAEASGARQQHEATRREYSTLLPENKSIEKTCCPTCSSEVSVSKLREMIEDELSKEQTLSARIMQWDAELAPVVAELAVLTKQSGELSSELSRRRSEAAVHAQEYQLAEAQAKACRAEAEALKPRLAASTQDVAEAAAEESSAALALAEEGKRFQADVEEAQKRVQEATAGVERLAAQKTACRAQIEAAKLALSEVRSDVLEQQLQKTRAESVLSELARDESDLTTARKTLADAQEDLARLSVVETVLGSGSARSRIAATFVPLLNKYAAEFVTLLRPSMSLEFSVSSEGDIGLRIIGTASPDYRMCSGGEKEIIRLAVDMGLSLISLGGNGDLPDILFLDEIFGSLDRASRGNVFTLLRRLRQQFPRILVVTHDAELKKMFKNVLLIEKHDGISQIIRRAK